jgi:protoporphyrinogen/coproporphyrinogen III oxidase
VDSEHTRQKIMRVKTKHLILVNLFWVLIIQSPLVLAKDLKVAIIGAGMSGLTAGHYLKKAGFSHVTIFEKEAEIGGKVLSRELDGALYDLGAVWVFKEYTTILEMIREFNIPLRRFPAKKTILTEEGKRLSFLDYGLEKYDFLKIFDGLLNAKKVLAKYAYLKNPGFAGVTPDLFESFENFVKKNKLESIVHIMEPFLVGTGYGYSQDVPAIYILKPTVLIFDSLVEDIINEKFGIPSNAFQFFSGGFQAFLEAVAKDLEVKTNEEVLKVTRVNGEIEIQTPKGIYVFDRLIISTPPDATLKFLDATEEENFLFSKMQSNFYQITAFKGRRLPKSEVIFLAKATDMENRGVPAVLANWGRNNNVWVSLAPYDIRNGYISPEVLRDKLRDEVKDLGGEIDKILFSRGLTYFFHYNGDFLKHYSPHKKLESIQGNLGTYYIGGHLNFESVEHSAQYAKEVVRKYFTEVKNQDLP